MLCKTVQPGSCAADLSCLVLAEGRGPQLSGWHVSLPQVQLADCWPAADYIVASRCGMQLWSEMDQPKVSRGRLTIVLLPLIGAGRCWPGQNSAVGSAFKLLTGPEGAQVEWEGGGAGAASAARSAEGVEQWSAHDLDELPRMCMHRQALPPLCRSPVSAAHASNGTEHQERGSHQASQLSCSCWPLQRGPSTLESL